VSAGAAAGLSAEAVSELLGLAPHPEGGFFRETFRAARRLSEPERAASTAIYFLLRSGEFSAFHAVTSDEVWHLYLGAPVELHTIDEAGRYDVRVLGTDLRAAERPQIVVPASVWQAARVLGDGFSLCGCTVAPGFDFADFEMPSRAELCARFPSHAARIAELTR